MCCALCYELYTLSHNTAGTLESLVGVQMRKGDAEVRHVQDES